MIIPEDDAHDFTPVEAPFIQVGQEVVFMLEAAGEIVLLIEEEPGRWTFAVEGDPFPVFGTIYDTPPPELLWGMTVYKRQPKPGRGSKFTAADGSRWVYPALPHGLYRCWQAGTVHGEGLAARSEIDGLVAD